VGAAFGLGLLLGPALGGLLSVYGLRAPAFIAAGLALANVLYALAALPESLPVERRSIQPIRPLAIAGRMADVVALASVRPLLLTIFLLNLAFAGLQSNFPLFSSDRFGWGPTQNGGFFAFVGGCAVLTQGFLIGQLQPRLGEARLALGGLTIMALGLALVAVAGQSWQLYPLVGCMALGSGLAIPALTSLVSRRADDARQGAVMGAMQALLSLTLVLGPALAGLLYDRVGHGAPYLSGGLLSGAALLVAWRGLRSDDRRPTTDDRQPMTDDR
jgi:predicted MFS family arabinose efflux permease